MLLFRAGKLSLEQVSWFHNSEGMEVCQVNASVSSRMEVWQNSQRLGNRCNYSDIQEGRSHAMYKLKRDITPQFARENICQMP